MSRNPNIGQAYPLPIVEIAEVEQIGDLMMHVAEQRPTEAELLLHLGRLVASTTTSELNVAIDNRDRLRIVGAVATNVVPTIDGMQGMVSHLVVDDGKGYNENYQGQGVGTDLLVTAQLGLMRRGVRHAFAVVDRNNDRAGEFFERFGYTLAEEAIVMARPMKGSLGPVQRTVSHAWSSLQPHMKDEVVTRKNRDSMEWAIANLGLGATSRMKTFATAKHGEPGLAILPTTRQLWFDAEGSPDNVRAMTHLLREWGDEQETDSMHTIALAGSIMETIYRGMHFTERDALVFRRRLVNTVL